MTILYKKLNDKLYYFKIWEEDETSAKTYHGEVGTRGTLKTLKLETFTNLNEKIELIIHQFRQAGYQEIDMEDHDLLYIEHSVDRMGTGEDVMKRHRLEDRMEETLNWSGLGVCDGGSIGSGTMEVCCFVVSFNIAKKVIEEDLTGTEFADYQRIYNGNE